MIRKPVNRLNKQRRFSKINFFAVQNDKAALVKYCTEEAAKRMEEADRQVLHILEEEIATKAFEG